MGTMLVGNRVQTDVDYDLLAQVYELVAPALLDGDVLEAFSPEWLALDLDDPRRQHALVRAALVWFSARVSGAAVPADVLSAEVDRRFAEASKEIASFTYKVDNVTRGWDDIIRSHRHNQRAMKVRATHPYVGAA